MTLIPVFVVLAVVFLLLVDRGGGVSFLEFSNSLEGKTGRFSCVNRLLGFTETLEDINNTE